MPLKFIVDAQLPKSLSDLLNQNGYSSVHTIELIDKNKTKDFQINQLSKIENRIVITKDVDFLDTFMVKSIPNKLILVRTGNITNKDLLGIFRENLNLISEMIERSSLVEIGRNFIAEHE